jgi:beta-galactosidase
MQRIQMDLSTDWDLILEDDPDIAGLDYAGGPRQPVHLPHTWNATDTFVNSRGYYRGVGWYRKWLFLPGNLSGKRLLLNFKGFFQTADFFINAKLVHSSLDGFTGELIEITKFIQLDQKNLIAVRVDNSHNPEILPGREIPDYILYGGIYREVELVATEFAFLVENSLEFSTPILSREKAQALVKVKLGTRNCVQCGGTLSATLKNHLGNIVCLVKKSVQFQHEALEQLELPEIKNPHLWDVADPYLYQLEITLSDKNNGMKDSQTLAVGFRFFEFTSDHGFFLNGRHLRLHGVNRHQDFGGLGNALPERLQRLDAELIKKMGGNFVRLSHYPQHPTFLAACDELGILVFAEIASWQHIGGYHFQQNALQMMEKMIQRDQNHPSIILWGLLNEGRNKTLFQQLNRLVKHLDPTRPTIYAENKPEEGDELGTTTIPDVLGLNYKIPHLDEIRQRWPDKKLFSSEHTNADMTNRGVLDDEIFYLEKLNYDLTEIYAREFLAGSTLWCMHDYATDYRPTWPHHKSGALDHLRLEKQVFWLLQSYWLTEPVLHIVGHFNFTPGARVTLRVISNCDAVELWVNGKSVGKKQAQHLFEWELEFAPGRLEARGDWRGQDVSTALETTGSPHHLEMTSAATEIRADGRDIALVDVRVLDAAGRCVWCETECVLTLQGPGVLCGLGDFPCVKIRGGRGRIPVRALTTPGEIYLQVVAPGLIEAGLRVRVVSV